MDKQVWLFLLVLGLVLLSVGDGQVQFKLMAPERFMVVTEEERLAEVKEKEHRLRQFLKEQKLDAILLNTVRNCAWVTGGADLHIVTTSELGCASLLLTSDKKYLITNNIEKPRLMNEEGLAWLGYEAQSFPWYAEHARRDAKLALIKQLTKGMKVGADSSYPGTKNVAKELVKIRYRLTPAEIGKYRWLGKLCAELVVETCQELEAGMTEQQIGATISEKLMRNGITPTVVLIGTDDRIFNYRHLPPTERKLGKYGLVNICAEKWGLVIAMTRCVHFGPISDELASRMKACAQVEATMMDATKPGAKISDIFKKLKKAYANVGYRDEWENHHQGGAIGYGERDYIGHPQSKEIVVAPQAFAWNPTVKGTKVEDTIIVFEDHTEVITETPNWPMVTVTVDGKEYKHPGILVR